MKIPNKRKNQQCVFNHLSDIEFKDVITIYKKCTTKPYLFLVTGTTLTSKNSLRLRTLFRKKYEN